MDAETFAARTPKLSGSWWPGWDDWLEGRSGPLKPAPRALGNRRFRAQAKAPGSYVPPTDADLRDGDEPRWWGRPLAETRRQLELARLLVDPVLRGRRVAHGDGRPVVLLPGFLANVQCSDRAVERVERHLERVHSAHGRRVALIGHSRGGHCVRALGARRPDLVSHAVSMGAGLQKMVAVSCPTEAAVSAARHALPRTGAARSSRCLTDDCDCPFAQDFDRPFPADRVRLTSIYSRGDGVVRRQSALAPGADSIEVTGSQVGLIFNRLSYRVIAAALAAPGLTADPHSH
jgi:pimeloyl-ACP methyl ester carboxylesterase